VGRTFRQARRPSHHIHHRWDLKAPPKVDGSLEHRHNLREGKLVHQQCIGDIFDPFPSAESLQVKRHAVSHRQNHSRNPQ
jgi:hypothetical protein